MRRKGSLFEEAYEPVAFPCGYCDACPEFDRTLGQAIWGM